MAENYGPTLVVPNPAISPYSDGLVDGATMAPTAGNRWENSVAFNMYGHVIINGYCFNCANVDGQDTKTPEQTCSAAAVFAPYLMEFGWLENTGSRSVQDMRQIAADLMQVGTSARLESLQVTGCTGVSNPVLDDATALSAATTVVGAVGSLVAWFYDADNRLGSRGTIYMSPVQFFTADAASIFRRDDSGQLRTTAGGHKVIVGNYPAGTVYGHTGDVDVYLSEVVIQEAKDSIMTDNRGRFRVERYGVAVWDSDQMAKVAIS